MTLTFDFEKQEINIDEEYFFRLFKTEQTKDQILDLLYDIIDIIAIPELSDMFDQMPK